MVSADHSAESGRSQFRLAHHARRDSRSFSSSRMGRHKGLFFFLQESPRDCGGDNLIYTLACEVQDVRDRLNNC